MFVGSYCTWVEKNLAKYFPILNLVLYHLRQNPSAAKFLVRGERATAVRHFDCFRRFQ